MLVFHGLHICGAARHCLELLELLTAESFETIVFAPGGGGHWGEHFVKRCSKLILGSSFTDTWHDIERYLVERPLSFISAHYDPSISWCISHAPVETPLFAHFHTEPEYGWFTVWLLRSAIGRCKRVFFPSETTRDSYASFLRGREKRLFSQKTAIIPNAYPKTTNLQPKLSATEVPNGSIRLGIITRLDPEKISIPLLIDTLLLLKSTGIEVEVKIAGGGIIFEDVDKAINNSGLSSFVELLGWVEDIEKVYAWANVTFLPSISETMPYAVLESIFVGKPVVLPRFGFFSTDALESSLIYTFDPGDAQTAKELILTASKSRYNVNASKPGAFSWDEWRKIIVKHYNIHRK